MFEKIISEYRRLRKNFRKKLIVGVAHSEYPQELEEVLRLLAKRKPYDLGLELPETYEPKTIIVPFFGQVYAQAKKLGILPRGLESDEIVETGLVYDIVGKIRSGAKPLEKVEKELAILKVLFKQSKYYAPPEEVIPLGVSIRRYERAIELLPSITSEEAAEQSLLELSLQREEFITRNIMRWQPEIVIIGLNHARAIIKNIPQYKLSDEIACKYTA